MEANSLKTHRYHTQHMLRIVGGRATVESVNRTEMQQYVNQRSKEKYRNWPIALETIRKEVGRFRAVWNWAKGHGIVVGEAPTKKLKYEKGEEDVLFQIWAEIERRIASRGLTEDEVKKQWEALFLRKEEIALCLEHVRVAQAAAFVDPMFVFVAHTGARRSEMMRSRVEDFDFDGNSVTIREKKRDTSVKETRRRVRMSPTLARVMKSWLQDEHPSGPFTFCHGEVVERSRTRSRTTGHRSGPDRPQPSVQSLGGFFHRVRFLRTGNGQDLLQPFESFVQSLEHREDGLVRRGGNAHLARGLVSREHGSACVHDQNVSRRVETSRTTTLKSGEHDEKPLGREFELGPLTGG